MQQQQQQQQQWQLLYDITKNLFKCRKTDRITLIYCTVKFTATKKC